MKAQLVRIGNSRGIRLPKPLIDEARLKDEVELTAKDGAIIIAAIRCPRPGWTEAAQHLRDSTQGRLIDPPTSTRFDDEEWEW